MAVYEYYCAVCEETFEKLVPMSVAKATVTCPEGHDGAMRKLSVVATVGKSEGPAMGGGCCGGSFGCAG